MDRLAVVIPNWNGSALLETLFGDLQRQTYPVDRVIVMDNGSTDDSARIARNAGACLIELGANTGFAHAVNCGIRSADAEWIAVLNNDVSLEPTWLAKLMQKLETNEAWFATGKLLDAKQRDHIDGTFDAICRGACAWRCGQGRPDSGIWNQPREIRFAPWTAVVFRASLFEKIGLLDEDFGSYLEDVDFGIRCAAAGFSGLYVPEAVAYHRGSATLGRWNPRTVRQISRNQVLLVAKHYPRKWILRYGWPILVAQTLWGFLALRHGALLAYLQGKLDGLWLFKKTKVSYRPALPAILAESEREIRELQRQAGFDLYWKLYYALT
jgi:GT2 family glycosyltransferase